MRRLLVALTLVLAAGVAPATAGAHPLGNFTTNLYGEIDVRGTRVYVLYVVDLAEIPTYQARAERERLGVAGYGRRLAGELGRRLRLSVDGEQRTLRPVAHRLTLPPGVAGLKTTRLEVVYDAGGIDGDTARLSYADGNYSGRIGWREVVVRAGAGAAVRSRTVPSRSISDRLRAYPSRLLQSPLDTTSAAATVDPGDAPGRPPSVGSTELGGPVRVAGQTETGFASLIEQEDLGAGVILLSLLIAMFWGAAHALTPGHGKAIVAAYLVGSRGTARHAFLLGGITTVTHTIGVFALGLVTLALSELVVPERLYPWLNLVSAVLVVVVGLTVLRFRIPGFRRRRGPGQQDDRHDHAHHHHADHGHHHHSQDHGHDHDYGHHHHVPEPGSGVKGLIAVGISGGLLPCPTALVVLLAAISLHRVGYGLLLIVAFSVGLASVITGIGLIAVGARRTFNRISFEGPIVRALPAVSALVIVTLGVAMTVRALPQIV